MTQAAKLAQLGSPGISTGFKNRIINGAMMIDQRNAGASSSAQDYLVDRFRTWFGTGTYTFQQVSDAPTGFLKSLKVTKTNTTQSNYAILLQHIEGLNTTDLNWGTANAATVTLSFWVKSSITGTYSVALNNSDASRSYMIAYTINSANTWEYKTATIAGDTTGTWLTTNGTGIQVRFNYGGSTGSGTAGSWLAGDYLIATGATANLGTTNNATWQVTGVQLEVGTTATDFEYRDYGRELALCQRYYYKTISDSSYGQVGTAFLSGSTAGTAIFPFPVPMRVVASSIDWSGLATCQYASAPAIAWTSSSLSGQGTKNLGNVNFSTGATAGGTGLSVQIIANNNSNAYIGFNAEL